MKKYWAKISMQNLDIIQDKSLQYLKKIRNQLNNNSAFQVFKYQPFVEFVPELLTAFDHIGMEITQICAFVSREPIVEPHKDNTYFPIRVNIPILNTDNTFTCFYEKTQLETSNQKLQQNGLTYESFDKHNLTLVDQCTISEPTLIRPLEIHNVEYAKTNPIPRITLSMVLNPIPYDYFPDIELQNRFSYRELLQLEISKNPNSCIWFKKELKY